MLEVGEYRAGQRFRVYIALTDNERDVPDFIEALTTADQKKCDRLIMYSADVGPPRHNVEKCRPLRDGIYELKPSDQIRILFYYGENAIILLTHAFMKKSRKTPKEEIERAIHLRELINEKYRSLP